MCKKLVIVKYLGMNYEGDYTTVGKDYGYFIETKKQIKVGDFICIGYVTKNDTPNTVNEDYNVISVVRVMRIQDDYDHNIEKGNELIASLSKAPIYKELIGKADLGGYFAEADKKRKREEITKKLEERFKEAEKMALYQKLAETDPEMKGLLDELEALK
jgi:hypothetical protein